MASDELSRLIAEQAAVECGTTDVEEVLARSADRRLLAILRLAGDTGDAAGLLLLGDIAPPAPGRAHRLTTSPIDRCGKELLLAFEWRTHGYSALFDVLTGHLAARPVVAGVVLGVEGSYVVSAELAGRPLGAEAARRAAEVAVRSLLGHLRAALEHPARTPASANAPRESGQAPLGVGPEMSPT